MEERRNEIGNNGLPFRHVLIACSIGLILATINIVFKYGLLVVLAIPIGGIFLSIILAMVGLSEILRRILKQSTYLIYAQILCIVLSNYIQYKLIYGDYHVSAKTRISKGDNIYKKLNRRSDVLDNVFVAAKDRLAIKKFLCSFLDIPNISPSTKISGDYHERFSTLFNRILYNSDSLEIIKYREGIKKTLTLDLMLYSPNKRFMFFAMTFDTGENSAETMMFIGQRFSNRIEFSVDPMWSLGLHYGIDYGHEETLCLAIYEKNESNSPHLKSYFPFSESFWREMIERHFLLFEGANPFEKSFWSGYWFDEILVGGKKVYRYQIQDLGLPVCLGEKFVAYY